MLASRVSVCFWVKPLSLSLLQITAHDIDTKHATKVALVIGCNSTKDEKALSILAYRKHAVQSDEFGTLWHQLVARGVSEEHRVDLRFT